MVSDMAIQILESEYLKEFLKRSVFGLGRYRRLS